MTNTQELRVCKQNPLLEKRRIYNDRSAEYFTLTNEQLFDHIASAGMSTAQLNDLIPQFPNSWHYLGEIFGVPLHISNQGRFEFGDSPFGVVAFRDEEEPDPSQCPHDYITRDIQGENRFLCKECNERFTRHPDALNAEPERRPLEGVALINTLGAFRDGCYTLTEAVTKARFSIEEFNQAIKELFPPATETMKQESIGKITDCALRVNVEPERTSGLEDIDAIFSDPDVTLTDLEKVAEHFPDIVSMDHNYDERFPHAEVRVTVTFVDGTKQLCLMRPRR